MIGLPLCLIWAAVAFSKPVRNYKVKEHHPAPPKWSRLDRAPQDAELDLRISLHSPRMKELEAHLLEVSHPLSAQYGNHLTAEELDDFLRPASEVSTLVSEWLEDNGIWDIATSAAGDLITARVPIAQLEQLLNTEYHTWQHPDHGELLRTQEWSLPEHLYDHIVTIQPTNYFTTMRALKTNYRISGQRPLEAFYTQAGSITSDCDPNNVTITCLREYYQTANYTPQALTTNVLGITGFLGESANFSDLNIFTQTYAPYANGYNLSVFTINGAVNDQSYNATKIEAGTDLEGGLDVQTAVGFTYPGNVTFIDTAGVPPFMTASNDSTADTNEPYLVFINALLALEKIPQVISMSYADFEDTVPFSYAQQVCNGFMSLGARGVSVFDASGDAGVGAEGTCFLGNDSNTPAFVPNFPSSCPYVTTVGATTQFDPEVAANDTGNGFTSGAGFSNYFARPSYQDSAVSNYLNTTIKDMYSGLYNASGRGYPDISAAGQAFQTIWDGSLAVLDGTSASTPVCASIFSLVNDALLAANRSSLGFLNPAIYSNLSSTFRDITSGSSAGCNTTGFPAADGWDAVTGLGSPRFPLILQALNLSTSSNTSSSA